MIIHIPRSPYYLSHFDFLSTSSQLWSQKMTPLSTEVSNCWGPQLHQLKISRIWSFAMTFKRTILSLASGLFWDSVSNFDPAVEWDSVSNFDPAVKWDSVSNPAVKYPAICQLSHRQWLPIEFIYGAVWLPQWFFCPYIWITFIASAITNHLKHSTDYCI